MAKKGQIVRGVDAKSTILENMDQIREMLKGPYTQGDIAKVLGMGRSTWFKWRNDPEIGPMLKQEIIDSRKVLIKDLEDSMYKKAKGFSVPERKVTETIDADGNTVTKVEQSERYFPPDTAALIFSLTNLTQRADGKWYNRQDIEVHGEMVNKKLVETMGDMSKDELLEIVRSERGKSKKKNSKKGS